MPVGFLSIAQRENFGRYTGAPSSDELARYFHLDDADLGLISRKRGEHSRLGFAVQLCTVRYLGTFLEDPLAVPKLALKTLADQLHIANPDAFASYSSSQQRWLHAAEIRAHFGYAEITEPKVGWRLSRWLYL
jgi:TnpA family transposase